MVYKRYIKRGDKIYGPYTYHSKKEGGKVISEYRGKAKEKKKKNISIITILILITILTLILVIDYTKIINITGSAISEESENKNLALIRFIIEIINAEHLDSNRQFISNIYEETKELDNVWTETIHDGEYVRVTFEENLTNENDITIFPKIISGNPIVEVYEKNGNDIIETFDPLKDNQYNAILLLNLQGSQDTFDLRVLGGDLKFDHVFDAWSISSCTLYAPTSDPSITTGNTFSITVEICASGSGGGFSNPFTHAVYCTTGPGCTPNIDIPTSDGLSTPTNEVECLPNNACKGSCQNTTFVVTGNTAGVYTIRGWCEEIASGLGEVNTSDQDVTVSDPSDTTAPKWFENSSNETIQSTKVQHVVNWTDDTALSTYTFSWTNGTVGAFVNDSFVAFSGTSNWSNATKFINNTIGTVIEWKVYVNDTAGNRNVTDTFNYTVTAADAIDPIVTLNNPVNNSNFTSGTVTFSLTCSDNSNLNSCNLYGNWSALGWHQNQTNSSPVNASQTNFTVEIEDGKFVWSGFADDTNGNSAFGVNRTILVDSVIPFITIHHPQNITYNSVRTQLNISVSDATSGLHSCWFSTDGGATNSTPNDCTSNFTGLTSSEGANTWEAYVNDTLGNENSTTVVFKVDTTNPELVLFLPDNTTYTTTSLSINYTVADSASPIDECWYTDDGGATNNTLASCANTTYTASEGSTTIRLYANDTAGNLNGSESVTFFVDSIAPTISFTAITPEDNKFSSNTSIRINITGTEINPGTRRIQFDGINYTLTCVDSYYYCVYSNNSLTTNKAYTYFGYINDTLGNSAQTAARTYNLDDTNPTVTYIAPTEASNANVSRDWIFANVSVTETNFANITYRLFNTTGQVNVTTYSTLVTDINWTTQPDQVYTYNVTVVDDASNENPAETRTITLDSTNPLIAFIAPTEADNSFVSRDWISATVSVTETNLANITYRLFDTTGLVNVTTYATLITDINWTIQPDETYTYNVTIVDDSSNENSTETRTITLDTTNPAVVLFLPDNITYTTTSLSINYTVSDTNLDECWYTDDGGATNNTLASCANTTYTAAQGSTTIRLYSNDTAGNLNGSESVTFFVDSINPLIAFIAPTEANASSVARDWISATVSVTEANFKNITYTLQNASGIVNETTYTTLITDINWTGLNSSNVNYFYNVSIYDTLTNFNTTETRSIVLDVNPPTITIESPTNTTFATGAIDYNISLSKSLHTAYYSIDEGANLTLDNDTNLHYFNISSNHPALADGFHNITFWVNDTVGNGNEKTVFFTVDTIIPNLTFVAPTETNASSLTRNYIQVNVTAADANLDTITISLYNSTSLVNRTTSSTSAFSANFTNLPDATYYFNSTANDSANNVNTSKTRTVTLDANVPQIGFIAPTEASNVNVSRNWIFANVSVTEANEDTVTFKLFNSTGLVNQTSYTTAIRKINFTNLPDETYTYNVTVNDTVGNSNNTETRAITLDDTNPLIAFTAPTEADNIFVSRDWISAAVSATETNLANITYRLFNSTGQVNVTTYTTLVTDINWTTQPDQTYTYNVTIVDIVDNENSTETRTITLDTINPALVLFQPQNITYTTTSLSINYTAVDTNLDECWYTDDGGATNNTLASCANTTYTASEGSTTIRLYANDSVNQLNGTESVTFFVDSINPLIAFIAPTKTNATSVTQNWIFANVSVTETNFKNITYTLQNASGIVNETTYTTLVTDINWTGLNNSIVDYYYNVSIYDTLTNFNTTETRKLTLIEADTTPPTITIIYPENRSYNINVTDLNYSIFDAVGVGSCWYSRNGGVTNSSIDTTCSNFTNVTSLVGNNTWTIYANDTAGNENSSSISFTKDLTVPNISFVTPTETNASSLTRNYIQVNVTAIDETNLDTITIFIYNSTSLVNQTTSTTSTFLVNFTNLPDATYYFNSTANDTANNVNTTETRAVTTDTGAPAVNYISPTEASGVIKNQIFVLINVTASDPNLDTITIFLYNSTSLVNQTASSTSPNSINYTNLPDSIYFYNATANDTIGNSATLTTRNITLDTIIPAVTLFLPDNTSYTTTALSINFTAVDTNLDKCWYTDDGGATNNTLASCANTTYTASEGSTTIRVYVNDTAGNLNGTESVTFFVDTVIPVINYVSPTEVSGITRVGNYIEVNVTSTDSSLDSIVIRLYNSTNNQINSSTTTTSPNFINFTNLAGGLYFYNATTNDTSGNNASLATRNITLDTSIPNLTIILPKNKTYSENESLRLRISASNYITSWYNIDNGANTTFINTTVFSITEGSHTIYVFANNSFGTRTRNVTFFVNDSLYEVIYTEYTNSNRGNSTNFSEFAYDEIQNLSNIVLENIQHGKIEFNEIINITADANKSDKRTDLNDSTNISSNRIELDSDNLPNFDKSATLYLYGLTFSNPRVLRDGTVCPPSVCEENNYSGGILSFNVTGFTVYSAEETPGVPSAPSAPPTAGGSGAEASESGGPYECEVDSECRADQVCWDNQCVQLFDVKILEFQSPIELGTFFEFTYLIKGQADINSDVIVSFWIEKPETGERVTSGSDTIFIGNFEQKIETTKIFLPKNVKTGVYRFFVEVDHERYQARSYRTIEIEVQEGVARITFADTPNLRFYIISAIIILVIILVTILYIKRRKRIPTYKKRVVRPIESLEIERPAVEIKRPPIYREVLKGIGRAFLIILNKIQSLYLKTKNKLESTKARKRYKLKPVEKKGRKEEYIDLTSPQERKKTLKKLSSHITEEVGKTKPVKSTIIPERTSESIDEIIENSEEPRSIKKERKSETVDEIMRNSEETKDIRPINIPPKKIIDKEPKATPLKKIIEKKPEIDKEQKDIDDEEAIDEMFGK